MVKSKREENHATPAATLGALPSDPSASTGEAAGEEMPSEEMLANAQRFASVMAAIDGGRKGLDDLPVAADDEAMGAVVGTAQVLRAMGPRGERDGKRHEATWMRLRGHVPQKVRARRLATTWWPFFKWGAIPVALAALVLVLWMDGGGEVVLPRLEPEWSVSAVARVDASAGRYAHSLLGLAAAPVGDTPLRALREAHFAAWRMDTVLSHRRSGGGLVR